MLLSQTYNGGDHGGFKDVRTVTRSRECSHELFFARIQFA